MRVLPASAFLLALCTAAPAQDGMAPEELLAIARTAYPGEVCWWERAEENLGDAKSWTLTFRYDYEQETGPDRTLILHQLPCFYGAYNFGSLWFTETEIDGLAPLHFAVPKVDVEYADDEETVVADMTVTGFSSQAVPINAEFDPDTQSIVNFSKWRGLGDASSSGTWSFGSGVFYLTHYEVDPTFNGEIDPIVVVDYDTP